MTTSIISVSETESKIQVNGADALSFNSSGDIGGIRSINGGQLSGFRNKIINGACLIAQRGTSFVVPHGTNSYGGPDRYNAVVNNANSQFTQSQSSLTYNGIVKKTVRQTVNVILSTLPINTDYWYGIHQLLEGLNCHDLSGRPVSVSFVFNTNVSGKYSVAIRGLPANRSFVSSFDAIANTPTRFTFSIPSIPFTINPDNTAVMSLAIGFLNSGTYQTSTLNEWQVGNFVSAAGATNWGATVGNFIELTELQLEAGSVATPFEHRPYGMELALCQRYFQTGSIANPLGAYNGSDQFTLEEIAFPVVMRVAPTLLSYTTTISRFWTAWSNFAVSGDTFHTFTPMASFVSSGRYIQTRVAGGSPPTTGGTYTYEGYYVYTAVAEL